MAVATANMSEDNTKVIQISVSQELIEQSQERQRQEHNKRIKELYQYHGEDLLLALVAVVVKPIERQLRCPLSGWDKEIWEDLLINLDTVLVDKPPRAHETIFNNCKYGILDALKFIGMLPCSGKENWYDDYTQEINKYYQKWNTNYIYKDRVLSEQPPENPNPLGLYQ